MAHSLGAASTLLDARRKLQEAVSHPNPIEQLGGCERACTLMALCGLDADGDGKLTDKDRAVYEELGGRLVSANKEFQLNAGVVSALVLSVLFPLAYEEKVVLRDLAEAESWGVQQLSDLASFTAMQLAITTSCLTVLLSSRLYTQIAFWMPTLEAQLWYIDESASLLRLLEAFKNVTLLAAILTLMLETMMTATWLNLAALIPPAGFVITYATIELTLSRRCAQRLTAELMHITQRPAKGLQGEARFSA